ncbi:MAG: deoxynucleoside kinase [Chitinophagaceae bacterium]|nr:MAG: deoxynucleoside kinase [Chitinophagaceae bacterium]
MRYEFITIEGNIGAGKTTLSNLLSQKLNAKLILEQFADNPFLPKFYENPQQFAFPLELFFMAERYQQLTELLGQKDIFHSCTVSDYLFTKSLLFAKANLKDDEFQLYKRLFDITYKNIIQPDLIIYLHANVRKLQENIKKRSRSYELNIPDEYLFKIQEVYLQYIKQINVPILLIDMAETDFVNHPDHIEGLLQELEKEFAPGIHHIVLP